LLPQRWLDACKQAGQSVEYHEHAGYDHGYYFIASVIEAQLRAHAGALAR
jgi:S-formylglutathione hydrolase